MMASFWRTKARTLDRDADAAHEERDEAGEPEIHRELVPEAPEAGLGLAVRGHALRRRAARRRAVAERLGRRAPSGSADERAVAHAAARADEARCASRSRAAISTRGPSEKTPTARSGSFRMTPVTVSSRLADAEAVADPEPEAGEKRLVHERAAAADAA